MKKLFRKIEKMLADAALLEMGISVISSLGARKRPFSETLEEKLVEIAYAEAADYDEIHAAILREHEKDGDQVHPDDCQYGDNDLCFVQA
jgi:hypothetical protein